MNALDLSKSIKQKMDNAIELNKKLTDSLLIQSMFPNIAFPVSKFVATKNYRHELNQPPEQAVRCHLKDNKGVKYPLTFDQYQRFNNNQFPAHQKEWEVTA
tara:strand:+ start:290 stop:592 length:303 start_codon:yes stop_codon:yes gene_type:complete